MLEIRCYTSWIQMPCLVLVFHPPGGWPKHCKKQFMAWWKSSFKCWATVRPGFWGRAPAIPQLLIHSSRQDSMHNTAIAMMYFGFQLNVAPVLVQFYLDKAPLQVQMKRVRSLLCRALRFSNWNLWVTLMGRFDIRPAGKFTASTGPETWLFNPNKWAFISFWGVLASVSHEAILIKVQILSCGHCIYQLGCKPPTKRKEPNSYTPYSVLHLGSPCSTWSNRCDVVETHGALGRF